MIDVIEDVRNEFKVKLTDNFEKEIIAFLNTSKVIFKIKYYLNVS